MKNLFLLIIAFLALSLNLKSQNESYEHFAYFGFGINNSNLSNPTSIVDFEGFEGYLVFALANKYRVAVDVGGFDIPSDLAKGTNSANQLRDSVSGVALYLGKTILNSKYLMFSTEGGVSFTTFDFAEFKEEFLDLGGSQDDFSTENIMYKERLTAGLNLKSRLEFKLHQRLGIVFNATGNLNFVKPYFSYGVGIMYGGGFRAFKRKKTTDKRKIERV